MSALYPDVPNVAGVPAVLRTIGQIEADAVLLVADAVIVTNALLSSVPKWGIFTTAGAPLLVVDTVESVTFARDWTVADYPVEDGGFGSSNKVAAPFDCRITLVVGDSHLPNLPGSQVARRAALLTALDAAAGSTTLYAVVTPEIRYQRANIVHYDYERTTRSGAGMLRIAVFVREIRSAPAPSSGQSTSLTATAQPSGTDPLNLGVIGTAPLTPVQQSALPPLGAT